MSIGIQPLNTSYLCLMKNLLVLNTQFLVFNTKFIILLTCVTVKDRLV